MGPASTADLMHTTPRLFPEVITSSDSCAIFFVLSRIQERKRKWKRRREEEEEVEMEDVDEEKGKREMEFPSFIHPKSDETA